MHMTSPTQFVEVNGIRFAYRRFGIETGVPLLFMQHFRGGMDHWDPMVTDGFARDRPVILFDNAGVATSSGKTPDTFDAMSDYAADFVDALGLSQIDLLGFSIGGFVAQAFTLRHPSLVRHLMLVGTGPRAGQATQDPKVKEHMETSDPSLDDFLYLFFAPSARAKPKAGSFGTAALAQERCRSLTSPGQRWRLRLRDHGMEPGERRVLSFNQRWSSTEVMTSWFRRSTRSRSRSISRMHS